MLSDLQPILSIVVSFAVLISVIVSLRLAKGMQKQMTSVTSKAFGFLAEKGVDAKKLKQVEGLVTEDVQKGMLTMFPEIEIVLGWLSPDTLEMIKENPAILPILIQRYGPLIGMFKGRLQGAQSGQGEKGFDFG